MSAQSGGIEWSSVIKPLLTNRYDSLNKNEVKTIIKAIQKIEPELFDEENDYQQFYTAFAALAADKLCHCKSVCQTLVGSLQEVCAVLIRYILYRLTKVTVYEIKWLLPALKSLCGESGPGIQNNKLTNVSAALASSTSGTSSGTNSTTSIEASASNFDYNVVASVLRTIQYPEPIKFNTPGEKDSPKSDAKKPRTDLSAIILQQITLPLEVGKMKFPSIGDEVTDCSEMIASGNKAYFQSLEGAEILFKVCMNLPNLSRYRNKYLDSVFAPTSTKSLYLPLTQGEASQIRNNLVNIAIDVTILHQALSFWAVQKLTPSRIVFLSSCAISALYCGILASISSSVLNMSSSGSSQKSQQSMASSGIGSQNTKESDEYEENAHLIVDKSLEVYTMVGNIFKVSARSHIYHNHLCFGAWLLVTGIQGAMGASGSSSSSSSSSGSKNSEESSSKANKAKSDTNTSTSNVGNTASNAAGASTSGGGGGGGGTNSSGTARVNLFKVQQGFGVLNAAIGNHCIKLLSELLDDLRIDTTCNNQEEEFDSQQLPEPAQFNILGKYSSLQRVIRVLNAATLHQLFTFLATVSYRKACSLKRVNTKDRIDNNDPISYSDSTTYFNDTMSCSDTSEEDDSESYLGHWFKETISPEGNEVDTSSQPQDRNNDMQGHRLVPTLDEPHEYLDLACQIFCFLEQFFASHHNYLNRYVGAGLSDQQMLLLANIIKDLDRDAARVEIEPNICAKWQTSMIKFSGAVGRYLHNLISAGLLSEQLQSTLLQHLSVSPWATDLNTWPLQVYPNTLSVLVQILLLKPTQEKEAACLSVWHRLINTLVEGVCTMICATDVDYEDLNVEHAQLLLFLFHSLNLMQKKSILLLTAGAVVRCSEVCRGISSERPMRNSQVMLLSRLLLLLEYLMKNLYNAPPELLDQVRWNLFSISTLQESQRISDIINSKTKLSSHYRKDIEEKFRKAYTDFLSNIRPTFYCLSPSDSSTSIALNLEFKLDGLAWNFILCSPDKLKYPLLIDALMDILRVIDMSSLGKSSMYSLCAIQYCFSFCWKLLLGLPSSNAHIEAFDRDNSPNLSSLLWAIRFLMPASRYLIVNSLIKQGVFTQGADALWGKLSKRVSDIRFALKQTRFGVNQFNKSIDKDNVLLSQIILLDATLGYMRSIAWAEMKGLKPPKAPTTTIMPMTSVAASSPSSSSVESSNSSPTRVTSASQTNLTSASPTGGIIRPQHPALQEQPNEEESSFEESSTSGSLLSISTSATSTSTATTVTTTSSNSTSEQSQNEEQIQMDVPSEEPPPPPPTTPQVPQQRQEEEEEEEKTGSDPNSPSALKERAEATNNLLTTLIENARIVSSLIKRKMNSQLSDENPEHVLDLTLSFVSSKHPVTTDLNMTFLKLLPTQDLEVISIDWGKCLYVSEEIFDSDKYPVEDFTLLIIDSHVTELTASPHYSTLYSLKHCLKTLLHLINLILPLSDSVEIRNELKTELVAYLLDARYEYVYEITDKCLSSLYANESSDGTTNSSISSTANESMLLLVHEYIIKRFYKLLLDFAEELRNNDLPQNRVEFNTDMLIAVMGCLTELLDKPIGLKAMYNYFKPHSSSEASSSSSNAHDGLERNGSLVELMLSFTGTNMSITYAKKTLQFIEKLFLQAEKEDSPFSMDELVRCFNELANIETSKLKTWLSHIIYGPNGNAIVAGSDTVDKIVTSVQPSSTPSSNAQTPTNMATVSALPSISDQFAQSFALDAEAIDIDDEAAATAATGGSSAAFGLPNSAIFQSLYLWAYGNNGNSQNNGNSCNTNQSEDTSQEDPAQPPQQIAQNERNGALLLNVIRYIVKNKQSSVSVITALFQSLLQLGQSLIAPRQAVPDFSDILQVMITLADTQQGRGHAILFSGTILWLEITKYQILQRATCTDQLINVMPQTTMENITALLMYLSEVLQSLGFYGSKSIQPPWDDDVQIDLEELIEEFAPEEDEAFVDDSDEDSLNNKLCTFSQTQKEFMNQHWYHCHTCNMVNTVGVCSICARVCHKGHDVSYAKYGNFFCDCGAKEDGSCQALSRRVSSTGTESRQLQTEYSSSGYMSSLSNKRRALTPPKQISTSGSNTASNNYRSENTTERVQFLTKLLENCRDSLLSAEQWSAIVRCILDFFDIFLPYIRENCDNYSIVGCQKRAKKSLAKLQKAEISFQMSEDLMIATLGSQEGAFENVRMNYSGDQGNTIKQLLSSGLVRRVALCCLSSIHGKRQHLAVSLEKGKITILQLSALLKQADAAKRKLTLTQLASAPIPCTILSLTPNAANEDCLAVCGLKECHILTFSNSGTVNDHIVITPQVENGNFIKKAIWLPGSQTLLALATADYVKIYELSEDSYSPKYYFLVALGKIRDCCFVYQNGSYYMLLIASSGYIYYEKLNDQSLAKHGDFYVTNTLELNHPQIKDVNGQLCAGGVSLYYSHALQLIFFSFISGKSFMASLANVSAGVKNITCLQIGPNAKNSSKGPAQPLSQWMEIAGHPGVVCAMMHTSNNPVILMITPEKIFVQEIKAQSQKARIMDMVAIRHTVAGVEKTSLILLCEDGSLRILTAHAENTGYWLTSHVQPLGNQLYSSTVQMRSNTKKAKRKAITTQKTVGPNGVPIFPIDFFEHCVILSEVDFGGNDLLQIYNKQKLKTRLFSTGMFVASTKPTGFTLEINNNDPNMCIVGIRILIGTQDILRAPTAVTIYGRTILTPLRRARWFDIPFTREEMLQSDKTVKILFGKSQDPENVCMLDSIEVYGKSKELIGWPDDNEDSGNSCMPPNQSLACTVSNNPNGSAGHPNADAGYYAITYLDKMVTNLLEVLDCSLNLLAGTSAISSEMKMRTTKTATNLLLLPTPNQVQMQSRFVLATLLTNRNAYHQYKDSEVLAYVDNELQEMKVYPFNSESLEEIDPEAFYRLVLLVRGIANTRPNSLAKICSEMKYDIVNDMIILMGQLHAITPILDEPVSIVRRGLSHTETTVHCLVEIMYAFALSDLENVERMTKYLIDLLKNPADIISHSAKDALILLLNPRLKRRKVAIVTPPACSTPTPSNTITTACSINPMDVDGASSRTASELMGAATSASSSSIGAAAAAAVAEVVGQNNAAEFVDPNGVDALQEASQLLNLESLMGGFPQILGLPHDADDEAIMDIAIALSLQQHDGESLQTLQQSLANLRHAVNLQSLQALEGNGIGMPPTASSISAGGSDDEGSNVATEGSTLRTSPAEPVGSGGSESGGSGVESIGGISGRSSTYGDPANSSPPRSTNTVPSNIDLTSKASSTACCIETCRSTSGVGTLTTATSNEQEEMDTEDEKLLKLHDLRIGILENIILNIKSLDDCNGLQAIPLIQVILMLTTDLNGNNEKDQKILNDLLTALINYSEIGDLQVAEQMKSKNDKNEVRLVILSLFGVLMGKTKSKQAGTTSPPHQFKDNASFVASTAASVLNIHDAFSFARVVMESLLPHWVQISSEQTTNSLGTNCGGGSGNAGTVVTTSGSSNITPNQNQVLKPVRYGPKPDITTIIPYNYLKNYPDIFECYDALLTEVSVRLPYQILRLSAIHPGTYDWYHTYCEKMTFTLCEYMMLNLNALLRRQVRKLLMYICGNKEKFRMYRDGHSLGVHFKTIKDICKLQNTKNTTLYNQTIPVLSYDQLVELTENLRTCQEISQIRTGNWQKFCLLHDDVVPVLIEIACYQLDDGVSPIILQLLQAALCNNVLAVKQQQQQLQNQTQQQQQQQQQQQSQHYQPPTTVAPSAPTAVEGAAGISGSVALSSSKSRSEREKSEDVEMSYDSKFDSAHCSTFVHQISRYISDQLLNKFIRIFLLETNITAIRWQAHSLLYAIYEHSTERQKEKLISLLWNMWPLVPVFGRRTAQFVDILGFLTLSTKTIESKLPGYTEKAVEVLRQQNELLAKHPNGPIYSILEQILQVSGYFLESEPCLVCNNPEVPFANIKLPSIKSDTKFTTTTMIVKLVQCHTISKLVVRIADLKRNKMVRTINIYYNNRTVQAVVELKNRPSLWHKARSVTIQSGQTEVKIDFPLPITACNLMVEYADFYETVTGSSENLQCPRCSAAVPAYPGVCGNCGENVFQCHKCRAINYDEKDPFLCHSCGFCKYAKFDFSIYGRVCCAVDPIESAEDRAKTVQIIHSSLERADRIYRQLQTNKQMLELLIQRVCESRGPDRNIEDNMGTVHSSSQVNKIIQVLAQKYCVESKASFEELSKIVQKVKACRGELVAYDRSQQNLPNNTNDMQIHLGFITNRCYGCALASTEQCLTLLRAMASNFECRLDLYSQGLVNELAEHNLRRGTPQIQDEVRNLLVLLTKQNEDACLSLLDLISERVRSAVLGAIPLTNLDAIIHHEMILLEALIAQDDFCWEEKLKVVFDLFLVACSSPHCPTTAVIQPCLRIMQALIGPLLPTSKANFGLSAAELPTIQSVDGLTVNFNKWMRGHTYHQYAAWKKRMPANPLADTENLNVVDSNFLNQSDLRTYAALMQLSSGSPPQQLLPPPASPTTNEFLKIDTSNREEIRMTYLMEKYGKRWHMKIIDKDRLIEPLILNANWLQPILFNTNSRFGRQLVCSLLTSLSRTHERKREILNLLTGFLCHVGEAGEASADFLSLYRCLAADTPWRQYLVLRGVLGQISQLLSLEIAKIHRLEETTLSSDLSLGYALRQFVELLSMFLETASIRQVYKTRLLGTVLEGYLSLRKLVVQRTRLIDDGQEKLLEMLEEMTSGTEEETRAFMEILIDTVEKTSMNDIKTPVFIFERLYSIIHPEENDESEFFMTLEKDPQQEDFLQGRMLGNPYPSNEVGLGPLMRNIKNKICRDCELIALLDDDNGMELLVNNKIISLDLAVKDVFKKIWLAEGGERDAMRIVYRMRGLLGDATEEFVETLNNKSQEEIDTEQLYRMANVLADCKGLKVMLDRIGSLQSYTRTRELMQVLLKLFLICVKVKKCQDVLCQPELGAINTLLKVLQICLGNTAQSPVTEQLLEIMETILSKSSSDTLNTFSKFSLTFGGPEYVTALISCTECANVRTNPSVLRHLIRVLAALVYGNDMKMALLCQHFMDIFDFDRFDVERTPEEEFKMELFCVLTNQIEHNCIGGTLKDYIVGLDIVEKAINYITKYAPCVKPTLLRTDSDELKEFISRPSLKYILRFLTGLANKHEATQIAISKDIIPIIHRLEQVSSDEHVGSLAENLLEALCTDLATAARVQEVRDFTRAEKKRLAMATREKQLDALGMRTNEKGQVTAKGAILQKMEKLREETGLACFICREGYSCQPAKVLGIYTFTKRCNVEEFELKTRKTAGYTTVTHFNIVHVDCHTSAIRSARGRDEWERASLQNANTRCNGLLPLWGPDVSETSFSACMTRHTSYMAESTQRCDISFTSSIHDLKLLLMRFAWERSFHDDAGGGGPQSNMNFIPYLLFYAVYLQLASRSAARDTKTLMSYLNVLPSEKWLESGYEVDGPLYMITVSLALHSPELWNRHKITHLRRLLSIAQARSVSPSVLCKALLSAPDRQVKDYTVYKPYLMIFGLIDMIYNCLFKTVTTPKEEDWSISLFDYIRKNDEGMLKATADMLQTFTDSFLPCASFGEFCDVAGLLHLINEPDNFIQDIITSLPTSVSAAASSS